MTEQQADPIRFGTKIVVVLRDDLPTWQRLNMTAFLVSGIAATAPESIGAPYADADGTDYLPMFGQPVMVFAGSGDEVRRTMGRALSRGVRPSVFTDELFATGNDLDNRAAVAAVPREQLRLAGMAFRCPRKDADKITKGLSLHG